VGSEGKASRSKSQPTASELDTEQMVSRPLPYHRLILKTSSTSPLGRPRISSTIVLARLFMIFDFLVLVAYALAVPTRTFAMDQMTSPRRNSCEERPSRYLQRVTAFRCWDNASLKRAVGIDLQLECGSKDQRVSRKKLTQTRLPPSLKPRRTSRPISPFN
jgi:hypothetical protein